MGEKAGQVLIVNMVEEDEKLEKQLSQDRTSSQEISMKKLGTLLGQVIYWVFLIENNKQELNALVKKSIHQVFLRKVDQTLEKRTINSYF